MDVTAVVQNGTGSIHTHVPLGLVEPEAKDGILICRIGDFQDFVEFALGGIANDTAD